MASGERSQTSSSTFRGTVRGADVGDTSASSRTGCRGRSARLGVTGATLRAARIVLLGRPSFGFADFAGGASAGGAARSFACDVRPGFGPGTGVAFGMRGDD